MILDFSIERKVTNFQIHAGSVTGSDERRGVYEEDLSGSA
jgi:hypothetical protein